LGLFDIHAIQTSNTKKNWLYFSSVHFPRAVTVWPYYRHVEKWLTKGVDELLLLLSFWQMTLTRNGESPGFSFLQLLLLPGFPD